MSLVNLGLGGTLTFSLGSGTLPAMGQAASAFNVLNVNASKLQKGMGQIGGVAKSFSLAMLPVMLGFEHSAKTAADFEQELANIKAVSPEITRKGLDAIKDKTLELGRTTKFTAIESVKAFQGLERAGLKGADSMRTIGPVLTLAAASGEDVNASMKIVTSTMEQFNKGSDEAAHIADVFARALSLSQEDLTGLGEGLKYAIGSAKGLKLPLEDLVAQLVTLRDAGIEGSMAGTSLGQAYTQLVKPTARAQALLQAMNVTLTDSDGNLKNAGVLVTELMEKMAEFKGTAAQAAVAQEIFGVRGGRAYAALAGSLDSKLGKGLKAITEQIRGVNEGFADTAAATRLNTLEGATHKLKSAWQSFVIEVMLPMLPIFRSFLDKGAALVTGLISHFKALSPEAKATFTKVGAYVFIALTALTGITTAVGGIALVVTHILIPAFAAVATLVSGGLLPVLGGIGVAIGAGVAAWHFFSGEIKDFLSGFSDSFEGTFDDVKAIFTRTFRDIRAIWNTQIGRFSGDLDGFQVDWYRVGSVIAEVLSRIITDFATVAGWIARVIAVGAGIVAFVGQLVAFSGALKVVGGTFNQFVLAFDELVNGHLLTGLTRLGVAIIDSILLPLRAAITSIIKVADSLGYKSTFLDGIRKVAEGGFASLIPPAVGGRVPDLTKTPTAYQTEVLKKKQEVNVKAELKVDGRTLAAATTKVSQEISERAGFATTPYQRRLATIHGAVPVPAFGR